MTSLRDALQAVYDRRGELTPRLVVAEWRDPEHPDHGRLEWDDALAGERYREVQAQKLIRSVTIIYRAAEGKRPESRIRAWQTVRGEDGHTYEPSEVVANDPILSQIVLMDMKREWKQLQARYGHFAEFVQMVRSDTESAS